MLKKRIYQFLTLHKFLLPYWDKQVLIFFCSVGFLSFGVIGPYMSKIVIDYGILRGDLAVFRMVLLCSAVLFLFSSLIGIIQKYISFYVSLNMGFNIRMKYFNILYRKPLNFFEDRTTGELLYRINADTSGVINLITATMPNILLTALRAILITSICIWLNWKATLLVIAAMPAFYFLNYYFGTKSFNLNREINEKAQEISNKLQDNLSQIRLYKAFFREKFGVNIYKRESIEQIRILIRNFWLGVANEQSAQFLNNGFGLLLTFFLGLQVLYGRLTLGAFVALSIYLVQLAGVLKSLGGIYQGIVSQFVYVDRFFEIYEFNRPDLPRSTEICSVLESARTPVVRFENVVYSYDAQRSGLRNLNLTVWPGETVAIIGRSGAGKSTIAKLMLGLYRAQKGRVSIFGQEVETMSSAACRQKMAIVLQEAPLLNKTIRENIQFGRPNVSESFFSQVCRIAEVDSFVERSPEGYGMLVGEHGCNLSQGQRQRIAIAMALVKNPAILMLDEATNQLDEHMEQRIIGNIRKFFPETALVVFSCRKGILAVADRVFEVNQGIMLQLSDIRTEDSSDASECALVQ